MEVKGVQLDMLLVEVVPVAIANTSLLQVYRQQMGRYTTIQLGQLVLEDNQHTDPIYYLLPRDKYNNTITNNTLPLLNSTLHLHSPNTSLYLNKVAKVDTRIVYSLLTSQQLN